MREEAGVDAVQAGGLRHERFTPSLLVDATGGPELLLLRALVGVAEVDEGRGDVEGGRRHREGTLQTWRTSLRPSHV